MVSWANIKYKEQYKWKEDEQEEYKNYISIKIRVNFLAVVIDRSPQYAKGLIPIHRIFIVLIRL